MPIQTARTKLSLAEFYRYLGFNPLHAMGVEWHSEKTTVPLCPDVVMSYDWQNADAVSRDQVANAIAEAEAMMERELGFRLAPSWEEDEWNMAARALPPEQLGRVYDARNAANTVTAQWGGIISGGVEKRDLLQAGVPINWTDEDGDGYFETGTVVTATLTDEILACEVEVYYPGHAGAARYQIRPATVTAAGAVATITFRRELAVVEELQETMEPVPASPKDDADFLDNVDVYRHWNDASDQGMVLWGPFSVCQACTGSGCPMCAYTVQPICLHLRSTPRMGILGWTPATWNATNRNYDYTNVAVERQPDIVRMNYYAGLMPPEGCPSTMDPLWGRAVSYLAVTLLDRPPCSCSAEKFEHWMEDFAAVRGGEQGKTFQFGNRRILDNPFGTSRGAVYAWRRVVAPDAARTRAAVLS